MSEPVMILAADADIVWTKETDDDGETIFELRFFNADGDRLATATLSRSSANELTQELVQTLYETSRS